MSYDSHEYILPPLGQIPDLPPKSLRINLFVVRCTIAMFGLFLFTGGTHVFLPGMFQALVRYGVFASSLIFIFGFHSKQLAHIIRKDPFLFIVIAIACISFTWSDYPKTSFQACFRLLRVSVFGVFFALSFSPRQQFRLLLANCWLGAVLSLFVSIAIPSIGVDSVTHIGAWQGIYNHKNAAGSNLTFSALVFFLDILFCQNRQSLRLKYSWAGLFLTSFLVLMTTSKSALVRIILLTLSIVIFRRFRWRGKSSLLLISIFVLIFGAISAVVLGNWEAILLSLDRDPTLTGRTIIWSKSLEQLMQRPWLGFGQGSFWSSGSEQLIYVARHFSLNLGFLPPTAHNGYIELLLDTGIIGALAFAFNYIPNLYRSLQRAYFERTAVGWLPLTIFASLGLSNLTESMFMSSPALGIYWMLYVLASISLKTSQVNGRELTSRPLTASNRSSQIPSQIS